METFTAEELAAIVYELDLPAEIEVDENQGIPAQFGIRGIPTLILFKNGTVAAQKVGALSKSQLTAFLDSHI